MKNHKKSERIKVAKLEVSEEKRAKALQYMGEGWTPEELANRVIKKASKRKSGAQNRKPGSMDAVVGSRNWKHDALLKKHAFAVKSYAAKKKKNEEEEPAAVDPLHGGELKGKTVAVKKDMCIALQPMLCTLPPRYIYIISIY